MKARLSTVLTHHLPALERSTTSSPPANFLNTLETLENTALLCLISRTRLVLESAPDSDPLHPMFLNTQYGNWVTRRILKLHMHGLHRTPPPIVSGSGSGRRARDERESSRTILSRLSTGVPPHSAVPWHAHDRDRNQNPMVPGDCLPKKIRSLNDRVIGLEA